MQIEFVDEAVKTINIGCLSLGDTFLIPEEGSNDVCMALGMVNDKYQYIILGEYPEVCYTDSIEVREVKSKLIVQI
jgi:hypothetical protein